MKPIFQKVMNAPEEGFSFKLIRGSSFDCPWHFHSEYELSLVLQSGGYRMVGDHLAPLRPGDLVLVGPNLPHIYQNDERSPGRVSPVRGVLIQFEESCFGDLWLQRPSFAPVRQLLKRAGRGVHVTGATRSRVAELMQEMARQRGLQRFIQFLTILGLLASSNECRLLASPGFSIEGNPFDQERMDRVCRFIHQRLDQPIFLPELARVAHLSQGAFSRFFRIHTGKTFPGFVNELRIGRACRLLAEGELGVTEIAFACGYQNLSNFNRQFQRQKQMSPRQFRDEVKNHAIGA